MVRKTARPKRSKLKKDAKAARETIGGLAISCLKLYTYKTPISRGRKSSSSQTKRAILYINFRDWSFKYWERGSKDTDMPAFPLLCHPHVHANSDFPMPVQYHRTAPSRRTNALSPPTIQRLPEPHHQLTSAI